MTFRRPLAALLLAASAVTLAAQSTPPAKTAPPKPVRVRAKLDGFDLAPTSGKAPNQIGGASRGIGTLALYAPRAGKSYSSTPTFYWSSDDPQAEYTFTLSPAAPGTQWSYKANVTGSHFTYPAEAPPLKPGETYTFTVQPTIDMMGGPVTASITILSAPERAAVESALAATTGPNAPQQQAQIFVDHRLWYDALAAYNSLIAANPTQGDLYLSRADLYDQLPQTHRLADEDVAKSRPHP